MIIPRVLLDHPRARRIALAMMVPVFWVAAMTIGYVKIEGWRFFDALNMTTITLARSRARSSQSRSRASSV